MTDLGLKKKSGGVLLSHTDDRAVPSALEGLTSEFGMGSGVAPPAMPPENEDANHGERFDTICCVARCARSVTWRTRLPRRARSRLAAGADSFAFGDRDILELTISTVREVNELLARRIDEKRRVELLRPTLACTPQAESFAGKKKMMVKPHGRLVLVSSTPRGAFTPSLSPRGLQGAFSRPKPEGNLILRLASRLDAFSGYPFPT